MEIIVLGVRVDNLDRPQVLEKIRGYMTGSGQHYIVTTNPEFIMAAQRNTEFRSILNKADLSVADGFGLALAARRIGANLAARIPGVELMLDICRMAAETGQTVFFLGARHGIAEQAAVRLIERFPNLKIAGTESGYRGWHRKLDSGKLVEIINRRRPDILFVAFGQVKQEEWIYHHLSQLSTVRVAMGVGGSFDYVSGRVARAPRWMRTMGLEWLYRMLRQPWRLPRIINAVFRFGFAAVVRKPR